MVFIVKAVLTGVKECPDEIRRLVLEQPLSGCYESLCSEILEVFTCLKAGRFILSWKDPDGDIVTFSSDRELQDVLAHTKDTTLRLFIKEKESRKKESKRGKAKGSSNDDFTSSPQYQRFMRKCQKHWQHKMVARQKKLDSRTDPDNYFGDSSGRTDDGEDEKEWEVLFGGNSKTQTSTDEQDLDDNETDGIGSTRNQASGKKKKQVRILLTPNDVEDHCSMTVKTQIQTSQTDIDLPEEGKEVISPDSIPVVQADVSATEALKE
ncbi:hypothetical protein ScPMuIL_013996 [Solemya velum]